MDALFIVVAELLLLPLLLWGLIVIELVLGTLATLVGIVLGRRRPGELISRPWLRLRRRLAWSLALLGGALLVVDLFFFEPLVNVVLGSVDDREDLDLRFAHAEGSFILGRIELEQLELAGTRGELADPSARFALHIDSLVIDIDTAALLALDLAVEELALDGVQGSYDRLRRSEREPARPRERGPAREFRVDRFHVGSLALTLRDHVGGQLRELPLELVELDIGPLRSDLAAFDLLYRSRGSGAIAGIAFEMAAHELDGVPQLTLDVHDIPLDELGAPLERAAGVRAAGKADLHMVNRYHADAGEPELELDVTMTLRELDIRSGERATLGTKLMLELAGKALARLGPSFPVAFEVRIAERELAGARNFADSGVAERVGDAIATALRDELQRAAKAP